MLLKSFCLQTVEELFKAGYVPNGKPNQKTFSFNMPPKHHILSDETIIIKGCPQKLCPVCVAAVEEPWIQLS